MREWWVVYLATQNAHVDVDGRETFVRKGDRYADNDPMVKRVPAIMDRVSVDAPPAARAVRAAVAAVTGQATGAVLPAKDTGKGRDDG